MVKGKEESSTRDSVHTACISVYKPSRLRLARNVSNYVAQSHKSLLSLGYPSNSVVLTRCLGREAVLLTEGTDTNAATQAWLMDALGDARKQSQTKLVDYLEEVLDDSVFEVEMASRKALAVG